ncbi:hypothetical protein Droror1_Dr00007231 [Drosera rotundifolia]
MATMRSIAILFCILVISLSLVDAQTAEQAECIKEMLPCKQYLHSDKPPSSCCFAMKTVLAAHVDCLCAVVNNAALLATYNMTRDQALEFPSKCNITIDPNVCNGSGPPPSPSHGSTPTPPPKSSASRISQGSAGTMTIVATVVIAVFSSIISSSM